jgi:uncharacterized protein YdiU (UPF0061 family)
MRAKLGLQGEDPGDAALAEEFLAALVGTDWTLAFRRLADAVDDAGTLRPLFEETSRLDAWLPRWRARLAPDAAARMRAVNPIYVPRNLKVEEALAAAEVGDMSLFEALLAVISDPFTERPGLDAYALPAPQEFVGQFRTFCGT